MQHGVANFGRVDVRVFRGAEPDAAAVAQLKNDLHVKTILDLRAKTQVSLAEKAAAQAHGIRYVSLPLSGLADPSFCDVRRALHLLMAARDAVYVHCQHGCERTGTIVACYRIAHDHWSAEEAIAEARHPYAMSVLALPMRQFIRCFARGTNAAAR